jgi:MFS transporter, DHA1 family, inner membrane transport protein
MAASIAFPASSRVSPRLTSPSFVLFMALFASQAGVLVLSPILTDIADDFGISIARAGQLRILAAPLAAVVALGTGRALGRYSPRALLGVGSALLAAGSVASAAAPTFVLLAVAQVPLWCGIAMVLASGIAATAAWSEPGQRTAVVSHALAGPPSAWIVGMPLVGLAASVHWRLAFLALPLPAAVLAGIAVLRRPPDAPITGAGGSLTGFLGLVAARRWALGELLANCAWAGTLVYSGALFTETYGTSPLITSVVLAAVAAAYLAGNRWGGRVRPTSARRAMLLQSAGAAAAVALTWAVTWALALSVVLFAATAVLTAARTVSGTVYGFSVAGEHGREVGAVRAATTQAGYLIGSLVGGLAIAVGGFDLLSVAFGGLFLASMLPYVCLGRPTRLRATRAVA